MVLHFQPICTSSALRTTRQNFTFSRFEHDFDCVEVDLERDIGRDV